MSWDWRLWSYSNNLNLKIFTVPSYQFRRSHPWLLAGFIEEYKRLDIVVQQQQFEYQDVNGSAGHTWACLLGRLKGWGAHSVDLFNFSNTLPVFYTIFVNTYQSWQCVGKVGEWGVHSRLNEQSNVRDSVYAMRPPCSLVRPHLSNSFSTRSEYHN